MTQAVPQILRITPRKAWVKRKSAEHPIGTLGTETFLYWKSLVVSLRLRVPLVDGADLARTGSSSRRNGRSTIDPEACAEVVPLLLPGASRWDTPATVAVHLVLVRSSRRKFPGLDSAIADHLVETARCNGIAHLVDDGDIGARGSRTAVVHPDPRLGSSTRIRRAAADLVLEASDAEDGCRSRSERHGQTGRVVRLVGLWLSTEIVRREGEGAGTHHVRHLDWGKNLFPGRGTGREGTGHRTVVGEHRRRSPIAGNRVRTADIGRRIDRTGVRDPSAEADVVTGVDGRLEHCEAADGEVDVGDVLDLVGRHFKHGFGGAVIALVLLAMLAAVVVVV